MNLDKETVDRINEIVDELSQKNAELVGYYEKQKEMFDLFDNDQKIEYMFGCIVGLQVHIKKLEDQINGV